MLYESRLNDATPAASTTAAGYDVLNLRDGRPYTFWQPTAIPATVTVDCATTKAADYCVIYSHNLGTKGCVVEVRKSTDNFAANDVLVATATPTDDKPLLILFTSTTSRYWRLKFTTGTVPTLAIAMLGNRLEVPAGITEGFDPVGRTVKSQYNRSNAGNPLGKVIQYREWKERLRFELLTWDWVRTTFKPAAEAWLESDPWLFSWNPDTYPKETYLVAIDGQWDTPHRAGTYCDLAIPVTGLMA